MQSLKAIPPRRDPAPSRVAYRMQRLWLTPLFRALLRVGLPVFCVTFSLGLYLSDAGRRAAISGGVAELRQSFEERPEFMLTLLSIEGASVDLADAIRAHLDLKLPQSSFEVDLSAVRARIMTLDAVAAVELRIKAGGILVARIIERVPVLVWRGPDGLDLVDDAGRRVARLTARTDRPDLPLIAGEGADLAVTEALQIYAAGGPVLPRIRGLVRMGMRRWDIVLDRGQRILLPEAAPVTALERIIALDQAQGLLARDVTAIDLRLQSRPVLRLSDSALNDLRRARGIDTSESSL